MIFSPDLLAKVKHVATLQGVSLTNNSNNGRVSGHSGSVNRMHWSNDGTLLASCSDDSEICLWNLFSNPSNNDRNLYDCYSSIHTNHTDGILALRVLPYDNNSVIVSGGADHMVEIHYLSDDLRSTVRSVQTYCHKAPVTYIENDPQISSSNVFFSVGEDGCVRQYDLREKNFGCNSISHRNEGSDESSSGSMYNSSNCILNTPSGVGIKSMRISPTNPNYFVLSTDSSAVTLHDRRMVSIGKPNEVGQFKPLKMFCPQHLFNVANSYPTYAEFSADGRNIVANFYNDHSYVFDVNSASDTKASADNIPTDSSGDLDLNLKQISKPADLLWRRNIRKCEKTQDILEFCKESLSVGIKTATLGLNITSYNMFSRAVEIAESAL